MAVRRFIGLFQIGFLDLALGAFTAHILYLSFYGEHAPILIYILGSILGALPDSDLFAPLLKKEPLDLTHRNTVFHQPLLLIPIPAVILSFVSPFLGLLWALPLLTHFIHDTIGESMGVQWLFPFSRQKFSIYDVGKGDKRKLFTIHSENYPGMTLDEAMLKKFYRLTPTSIIEAVLPIILLAVIIFTR